MSSSMATDECNACKFRCNCYDIQTNPKENPMNTYYIEATQSVTANYIVEAECEEDAIYEVDCGGVDPEETEVQYIEDIHVVDVEYGDVEKYAKLGCNFVLRGKIENNNITDALYSLLQQFDGKTVSYEDAELELVGFSVDHIEEA